MPTDSFRALLPQLRDPPVTPVAVAGVALDVRANTVLFSFVNATALKPLPWSSSGSSGAVRRSWGGRFR